MAKGPKVAVIGAGVTGSAAALSLARAGADVHLFDQFPFRHTRGSSHGPTRLFRLAYFERPEYVPLLRRALDQWRKLEREADIPLFVQSGLLEVGQCEGPLLSGIRAAADTHHLEIESYDEAALADRFPWFAFEAGATGVFETEAGYLLSSHILRTQINLAIAAGATAHPTETITGCHPSGEGLHLHTSGGNYNIDRMVLAPGAWASDWLGDAVPLQILEKPLFWLGREDKTFEAGGAFVPFAVERSDNRFFYGFPAIDKAGVKIAEHTGGRVIPNPDERLNAATDQERDDIQTFVSTHLPDMAPEIVREETCLYEMSPDGDFIVDRHPENPNISIAAGLSGHGFKFAPVIGDLLADMALDRDPDPAADFLKLDRFAK